MRANLSWKPRTSAKKTMPIAVEVTTETTVENLAAFPLPAPSSLATLTLHFHIISGHYYIPKKKKKAEKKVSVVH